MAEITENTKKILECHSQSKRRRRCELPRCGTLGLAFQMGLRQVSRVLHSMSKKYGLPW